jgi:arylformamidase
MTSGRVIDLTGPFEPGLWRYDEIFPGFDAIAVTTVQEHGYQMHRVRLGTHLGTHTDAPSHLFPGGASLDAFALDSFIGPGAMLDVTPAEPLTPITADVLAAAGTPARGDVAVVRTDWSARWHAPEYPASHPFLTVDAARWLVGCGVRCVAMDTAGLMDPRIDLTPGERSEPEVVDEILLRAGIPYVVGVTGLAAVGDERFLFVALPMKLAGMDGAPVRAAAITGLGLG